jgi:hypothetical protein
MQAGRELEPLLALRIWDATSVIMGRNMASRFDVTWKRRAIVEPLSMKFVSHEGRSQGNLSRDICN